jgi:anti-sigma factor RsiW
MTDQDLELLDNYLDEALSQEEVRAVEARLTEPEMAAELARLRDARQLRLQVWKSLEPSQSQVDRLMQRVESSLDRRSRFSFVLNNLRVIGAAAACILIGILTGWLGRSEPGLEHLAGMSDPNAANVHVVSQSLVPQRKPAYQVALRDAAGNIVAVQYFDTLENAKKFAAQINQLRNQQQGDNENVIVGDRF